MLCVGQVVLDRETVLDVRGQNGPALNITNTSMAYLALGLEEELVDVFSRHKLMVFVEEIDGSATTGAADTVKRR